MIVETTIKESQKQTPVAVVVPVEQSVKAAQAALVHDIREHDDARGQSKTGAKRSNTAKTRAKAVTKRVKDILTK
jgi:hypothetical protein